MILVETSKTWNRTDNKGVNGAQGISGEIARGHPIELSSAN
jgi:hypothetical protein